MKKKLQGLYLKTFCLLTSLLFISFFTANAQVHINGGPGIYPTISAAVLVAPSGAIITVDPGNYTDNVIIDKPLTINGPKAGVSANGGSRGSGEAIVNSLTGLPVFTTDPIASPSTINITIDGFTIQNGSPLHDGFISRSTASQNIDVFFQNNIVNNGANLFCGSLTRWHNVNIKNNLFQNGRTGVSSTGSAIQLNDAGTQAPTVTATVTGNVINTMYFAGILIDNLTSATISSNKISNVSDAGIQIASGNSASTSTIQNNEINNANTSNQSNNAAIRLYGLGGNNTENFKGSADIEYNLVTCTAVSTPPDAPNGFAAMDAADVTNVHINNNSFDLTHSIYNATGNATLNALCNWYGTICKTDIANKISGPVDYSMYLNSGKDNDANTLGFQPAIGTCVTPTSSFTVRFVSLNDASCNANDGSITVAGNGGLAPYTYVWSNGQTTATATGLAPNTSYTVTVKDAYCTQAMASFSVGIKQPPTAPVVGAITQPTCTTPTGSVALSGLPSSGTWTLTRNPGGVVVTSAGTGGTITVNNLAPNTTYTFTVTLNSTGCTSGSSGNVAIGPISSAPTAPVVGAITQPTCTTPTGSVALSGLPSSGTWTLTRNPGGVVVTSAGTGGTITVNNLAPNTTYTFTVTLNSTGCTSGSSGNVAIGPISSAPTAPVVGAITQPTCTTPTGSVALSGLPSSGTWTLTRNPGGVVVTSAGTGGTITVNNLAPNTTYTFTVTLNSTGCTSGSSGNVAIGAVPSGSVGTVTISKTSDDFCYGITLTANVTPTGSYTYIWKMGSTIVGTDQTLHLDNSDADGTYTVYITGGCATGNKSYVYHKQDVASNYTILGSYAVEFEQNNQVLKGSVGATNCWGWIDFDHYSSLNDPKAFAKASFIFVEPGCNVPNRFYSPADVALPTFKYNTSSTSGLSNKTVPDNWSGTVAGNYKNLTIGKNSTVTITGSIFGNLDIENGACVTFTQPVVNINDLDIDEGSSSRYTIVNFSTSDCDMKIHETVTVGGKSKINPNNKNVTFYVGDHDCDLDNFFIDGTNTTFNGNIYVVDGWLVVNGCNSTSSKCYMTGMFIADRVQSNCNYVVWNTHDCSATSGAPIANMGGQSPDGLVGGETTTQKPNDLNSVAKELTVKVLPNPSDHFFNLILQSPSEEPVQVLVFDVYGKKIEQMSGRGNQAYHFGDRYISGTYLLVVQQGKKQITTKLIKN